MSLLIALALQAATSASAAPPEKFSILAQRCGRTTVEGKEVMVCGGDPATSQRLPYPEQIVPDHGVPTNPYLRGTDALAAEATPCAARQQGCTVGFGPPIVPMVAAGVKAIGDAAKDRKWAKARARDGDRRQPIDMAASGPAGRLEP